MGRYFRVILLLSLCVAISSSCKRNNFGCGCSHAKHYSLPISIDWSVCGVVPQNVTILFYNSEDGELVEEHLFEHNSQEIQSNVYLGEGCYTAVVFNELRDQIDNVSCMDYENLSTLRFEGSSYAPIRKRDENREYIRQPGDLAVAIIENILITDDMIQFASIQAPIEPLLGVVPIKKSTVINLMAHIDNIYYARMPALVDLVGLSNGYYVLEDRSAPVAATQQFTMNNRSYDDDSYYDGSISTSITSFGNNDSNPIILDLLFKMVDARQSEVALVMDVTDQAIYEMLDDGSTLITIDVSFDEKLPIVEPEGSDGDSGFGAETDPWDDVDVPL